jgi:hypothetical protein
MSQYVHRRVVPVGVSGNEIERDLFLGGMGDDVADPRRLRSRGAADANPRAYCFEGASSIDAGQTRLALTFVARPAFSSIQIPR